MEKPLDAFEVKLALKIRELVSNGLVEEDIERLLTVANIRRFKWAVTHRYASADNSEIDELMGDKANGYLLLKWLRKTYPNERRESALSIIVAKFLSKEKLAQYSKELGLRELLIKPAEFKQTETDYEDMFEAVMGAFIIVGDKTFGEGSGALIVQNILEPIFVREGINPDKLRDYIDPVSLLKMATNVLYGSDPVYSLTEIENELPDGTVISWFGASVKSRQRKVTEEPSRGSRGGGRGEGEGGGRGGREGEGGRGGGRGGRGGGNGMFRKVEYIEEELGKLVEDEYERSKQKAKESVAKKALLAKGWTLDSIEDARRKKDTKAKEKYRANLAKAITEMRQELLNKIKAEEIHHVTVKGTGKKKEMVIEPSKRISDDTLIEKTFGVEVAHQLRQPIEAIFDAEKQEDEGDVIVVLQTTDSKGTYITRAAVRERPSQIGNAYFRLVMTYAASLRQQLRLPPRAI